MAADSRLGRQPQPQKNGIRMNRNRYRLWDEEEGATSIEYALIASLIAGVIALVVSVIGGQLVTIFTAAVAMFP